MTKEEGRGIRLRTKIGIALVFCSAMAAALFGAFLLGASQGGESPPVITSDMLGERLRDLRELASVEYHYTNMGRFEDQLDFYGWKVPFTTKAFIVSYDGVIKAGVDMSGAEVAVEGASVTVKLPAGRILSHEILEDSIEVFDESKNIFNPISISDYTGFTADQKAVMEENATGRGLLTGADEKARAAVEAFLDLLPGLEDYTVAVVTEENG